MLLFCRSNFIYNRFQKIEMATPQPQMQCGNSFQPQPMVTMTTLSQPEINSSLERKKVNQNRIGNLAVSALLERACSYHFFNVAFLTP